MVGTFPSFLYNLEVIDAIVNRALTIYPQLRERTDAFQCGKSVDNIMEMCGSWCLNPCSPQPWNLEQTLCGQPLSLAFYKDELDNACPT